MSYTIYIITPNLHQADKPTHSEYFETNINTIFTKYANMSDYLKTLSYVKPIITDYDNMISNITSYFPYYHEQLLDVKTCYITKDYIIQFIYDPCNNKLNEINQFASFFSYDNKCIFGPILITKIGIPKRKEDKFEHLEFPLDEFAEFWESVYQIKYLSYEDSKWSIKKIDNCNKIFISYKLVIDTKLGYFIYYDSTEEYTVEQLYDNLNLDKIKSLYFLKYKLCEYVNEERKYNSDYGSVNSVLCDSLINNINKDANLIGIFCNFYHDDFKDIETINKYIRSNNI